MIKYLKLRRDLSIISVSGEGFTIDAVGRPDNDFIGILKALGVTVLMEDSPQVPDDGKNAEVQKIYDELKAAMLEEESRQLKDSISQLDPNSKLQPHMFGVGLDEETKDD